MTNMKTGSRRDRHYIQTLRLETMTQHFIARIELNTRSVSSHSFKHRSTRCTSDYFMSERRKPHRSMTIINWSVVTGAFQPFCFRKIVVANKSHIASKREFILFKQHFHSTTIELVSTDFLPESELHNVVQNLVAFHHFFYCLR